jgi:hypothetical protein
MCQKKKSHLQGDYQQKVKIHSSSLVTELVQIICQKRRDSAKWRYLQRGRRGGNFGN